MFRPLGALPPRRCPQVLWTLAPTPSLPSSAPLFAPVWGDCADVLEELASFWSNLCLFVPRDVDSDAAGVACVPEPFVAVAEAVADAPEVVGANGANVEGTEVADVAAVFVTSPIFAALDSP